ncbi:MetQ/NlpA family ABC transporter substrate-binding protein [Wohlfahrtiimonas chitiniclastica]|uniref:MetQ/NlpA family ABC transporter substrate-binding protein n=1 Tax=Wohlfahrtiimonas chitiniclastica TaxID=400946 RepID=UPI001BCD6DDD|nr:MetQ/NlpA family ABC transporter substrate-binding protein [Wohlfahrtiimonas chitiniclastica]MBS7817110.1 methionine ABC transporter substrate-binding protein [Wohlfahrtiimonas chitiniclastica]MBS7823035.1 methionine ABC transporter substrate-binding protein [Wohlfahrtiimonas chitiniclastica]MBS7830849.1 methionine ABC transporter substrate-binding protein [Wohlfahrtiimonas chitiniclastica]MBS7832817.1 methionine ABC transporter substrate-binding protein [Wohlfahrtiimonas chitiniclastica]
MKHILKMTASVMVVGLLSACGQNEPKTSKKIVMGFGVGTYSTQFQKGIEPILEKQGYQVETKVFSHNKLIPQALKEGEVDATVHISTANMGEMNHRLSVDMIVWADVPSAPQSLRSIKHDDLSKMQDGMTIGVPNDPINLERAVRILEDLGWVNVDPTVQTVVFSTQAVTPKRFNVVLKPMDAALLPRAMEDLDFAIINGNFVTSKGEKISDGLAIEQSPPEHLVKVAIREVHQNEPWAKDLKAAYESDEFKAYILNEPLYDGFILPKAWR